MTHTTEALTAPQTDAAARRLARIAAREAAQTEAAGWLRTLAGARHGARLAGATEAAADEAAAMAALRLVAGGASVTEALRRSAGAGRSTHTTAVRGAVERSNRELAAAGVPTTEAALRILVTHDEPHASTRRTERAAVVTEAARCWCGTALVRSGATRDAVRHGASQWTHATIGPDAHTPEADAVRVVRIDYRDDERGTAPVLAALTADGAWQAADRDAGRQTMRQYGEAARTLTALAGAATVTQPSAAGASQRTRRPAEERRIAERTTERAVNILREADTTEALARWLTLTHASTVHAAQPDGADRMRTAAFWSAFLAAGVPDERGRWSARFARWLTAHNAERVWSVDGGGAVTVAQRQPQTFGAMVVDHYATTEERSRGDREAQTERSTVRWSAMVRTLAAAGGASLTAGEERSAARALARLAQTAATEAQNAAWLTEADAVRTAGTTYAAGRAVAWPASVRQPEAPAMPTTNAAHAPQR